MTTLENLTGKDYVSHSAMGTWLNCGWNYYLSRVQNVAENPSYWLVGGKSVHTATELYDTWSDLDGLFDPTVVFTNQWHKEFAATDNGMPFRAGGRATKAYPNKEDASWWLENGPKMVDYWVQFRQQSGYQVFLMPDGKPAIETELLKEVNGVKMRGYLDRLMVSPEGELTVVDIKTSAQEPKSNTQLGTYAILVEKAFGIRPTKGAYWMARTGDLSIPADLSHYTESRLGTQVKSFKLAVENNIFIPNTGFMCGTCSVNHACYAVNGKDSHLYPELTESEVHE
jgi:CRISPR/Cas system-associated exonuclease Cas4 (RecB family)